MYSCYVRSGITWLALRPRWMLDPSAIVRRVKTLLISNDSSLPSLYVFPEPFSIGTEAARPATPTRCSQSGRALGLRAQCRLSRSHLARSTRSRRPPSPSVSDARPDLVRRSSRSLPVCLADRVHPATPTPHHPISAMPASQPQVPVPRPLPGPPFVLYAYILLCSFASVAMAPCFDLLEGGFSSFARGVRGGHAYVF